MKIIDNSKLYPSCFEEVEPGECFIDGEDGCVCMRIDPACESLDFNAIVLDKGFLFYRDCGDPVRKVNGVVTIS